MCDFKKINNIDDIYENYFSKIYNYIFYRLLNREQTEDIVSEIFLKLISNLDKFDPRKASFSTWLFTIARNSVVDFYRKQKNILYIDNGDFDFDPAMSVNFDEQYEKITNEDRKLLYKAISELNEKQRNIIALKFFGEFNNRQISEMTGINESTVSTLCARALDKLKAALEISYCLV